MNIVDRYCDWICEAYIQSHPNVNHDSVHQLVSQLIQSQFHDIPCMLHNNMTEEKINTSITNIFDWMDQRHPITTGNGTFFKQHSEYLSPRGAMIKSLKKKRKSIKNEMKPLPKHSLEYVNLDLAQKSVKVIMNADYGGSGTPQSPFFSIYIPPATTGTTKNITTTLICCLEFSSGNDSAWAKLKNVNELFDMINNILNDTEDRELIDDNYTIDEVVDRLMSKMSSYNMRDMQIVKSYVSRLSNKQRTQLMLAFNIKLVLSKYLTYEVKKCSDYFRQHPLKIDNLTKEIIAEAGYGVKIPSEVEDAIHRISHIVLDNCIYNFFMNDCEIRADQMQRIIVCVTDTDSLMVHFSHYIREFQCESNDFRNSCIMATAIGMRLFVENVIPKFVSYISINMGIEDPEYRKAFVFKNEFAFLAMSLFAKKMYAASMFVQEGVPRDIHDIAITGLSFKKRDSAEFLEPIMLRLYDEFVLTSERINIEGILDEYYELRAKLQREVRYVTGYYKVLSVKDREAYDKSKTLPAQMRGSIVWNAMFPDEEILPMDRVIVVPLSYKLLQEYSTDALVSRLFDYCKADDPSMKHDPYICLPEHYKDIPEWLQPVIDVETLIDKLLSPFKQLLGLFDIYTADTKGGFIPARMIYI